MTQAIPELDEDLDFETVQQQIAKMIDDIKEEKESPLNEDERLEVAREMMGSFTAKELAEGAGVSSEKAHDKISYWLATEAIEAGTATEQGHILYGVSPEST